MDLKVQRDGKIVSTMTLKRLKNGDIDIEYVKTDPMYRGQGLSSSLLKKAMTMADKMGVSLVAFIEPDKSGGLTFDQEEQWLARYGFVKVRYDYGGYFKPVMIYSSGKTI